MAAVVTGYRSLCGGGGRPRTSGRQPEGSVGLQPHQRAFRWRRALNHAALGRFLALDHPGALSLGHTPFLHWGPPSARQRAPRAVQPGALQDLGQAGEAEAAE